MKNYLICCTLLVALFSCGKKSSQNSGGTPNPADGTGPSLSREDALNQMSPDQRAALEKWQASPEKDCSADAILNGATTGEYVDLNLISSKLENNSLAKLPDGKWAILSPGTRPGGLQTTKHNSGQQVNGQSVNKMDIQTQRDGGVCEAKIFGATVAKIQLATGILYFAFGSADKNTEIVVDRFDSQNPRRAAQVFTNIANPLSRAFDSHFLVAKPADLESLAQFVNIKKEKIKNFQSSSALVLPAQENWAPFAFSDQYLSIKGDSSLAGVRFLESTTFQIVMPAMAWTPESAKVLWTLPVLYSAEKMGTSGSVKFKLNSDKNNFLPVVRESNNKDAISCLKSRLFVLRNEAEPFQVSFDSAAGSCSILLESNYENAFLQDDKEFLPKMFKNVSPQRNISLNGWDSIFASLLEKIWESKGAEHIVENVSTSEVKGVDLPIASKFQQNAILVEGAWKNSGELFRPTLIQKTRYLPSSWTLRFFEQAPDSVVLNRVFKAAETISTALPEISNDIISSQAELPNKIPKGIENLENMSADFLKNIADYRTTLKLFQLDSVGAKKFSGVFNQPVTQNDLSQWQGHLNTMLTFREKELTYAAKIDGTRKDSILKVMERGVEEGWSATQTDQYFSMAEIAALKSNCAFWTSPVERIECAAGDKMSSAKGSLLDSAFEGRYAKLAPIFAEIYKKESTEFDLKIKLDNFWDPIWRNCSNEIFSERSLKLVSLVDAINGTADFSRKYKLENELSDLIDDCN